MRRVNAVSVAATVLLAIAGLSGSARAQVTAYEGARLIVGDGSAPIENATLVVNGTRIVQAGRAADVSAPAGAAHVSLTGKTVMPMIIDTHTHLSTTREALTRDLKRRAYYGVSAALSLGTDGFGLLDMRDQTIPGAARFFSAGTGITRTEPGRPTFQINSEAEGRKAVQQNAAHRVDIIKVWVDDRDGKVEKVTPAIVCGHRRRGAQPRAPRHRAHLQDGRCEGPHARRARRLRARRPRPGHRR